MGEQPGQIHATVVAVRLRLRSAPKLVLMVLATHACDYCGLTWLGMRRIQEETGLGETAARHALEELVRNGYIKIRAYPRGGRGRATEYIILPELRELSTAPCGKCQWFMANPTSGAVFDKDRTVKPRATRGVSAKHRTFDPQNPAPALFETQTAISTNSNELEPKTLARARAATNHRTSTNHEADPPASRSGTPAAPLFEPPPPQPSNPPPPLTHEDAL